MASITDTATTIAVGQVTVTPAAAVQIRPALNTRTKLTLLSSVPIFIGDTALTAASGFPPFGTNGSGGPYDIPTQDAVFAIAVGGKGTVFFAEFHN